MKRPQIWRIIDDRTRAVLGECQYKVFKTPNHKPIENPVILLKSIF